MDGRLKKTPNQSVSQPNRNYQNQTRNKPEKKLKVGKEEAKIKKQYKKQ